MNHIPASPKYTPPHHASNWFSARIKSFGFALNGIRLLIVSQTHARIHVCVAAVVIILGFLFQIERWEWVALCFAIAGVLAAEALNTAIEYLTDLVSPEYNPLAGKVKDLAAGAVLLFTMGAVAVGILIFMPKIWELFPL